ENLWKAPRNRRHNLHDTALERKTSLTPARPRCGPRFSGARILFPAIEPGNQAGGIPTSAAHLLNVGIELVDQRSHRQLGTIVARLVQHDGQVLAHPVHRKAEIELPREHGLRSEEHMSVLQSRENLVCRLLFEKKI